MHFKTMLQLLNDSDELNLTQRNDRRDNFESINKEISICVLGHCFAN